MNRDFRGDRVSNRLTFHHEGLGQFWRCWTQKLSKMSRTITSDDGIWATRVTMVPGTSNGKWHEIFWFLLYIFFPMANLVNVGTQDERLNAHGSNNTTRVAIGYQINDPKWRIPPPFSSLTFGRAVSLISILVFSTTTHWKALASSVSMPYRTTFQHIYKLR